MNFLNIFTPIVGGASLLTGLTIAVYTSTNIEKKKSNFSNYQVIIYKKNNSAYQKYKKIFIPMYDMFTYKNFEICDLNSDNECSKKIKIKDAQKNKTDIFLSEISLFFLTVQHNLNLLNSMKYLEKNSENKQLKQNTNNNSNCKQTNVQDLNEDEKKTFQFSIMNIISSYENKYFGPIETHIFLENFDEAQLESEQSIDQQKIRGFTRYSYFDYYYNQLSQMPNITEISNKYENKKTTYDKNKKVINFVTNSLALTYSISKKGINIEKEDMDTDIFYIYKEINNKSEIFKTIKKEGSLKASRIKKLMEKSNIYKENDDFLSNVESNSSINSCTN